MISAVGLACSTGADPDTQSLESADACSSSAAGEPWHSQGFSDQARRFHVEFDATPSSAEAGAKGAKLDAVVGLSAGPAGDVSGLGAIVRFNSAGSIDVRDGAAYRQDTSIQVQPGTTYHLRIDVHVPTHRYSVWIRDSEGAYTAIARDYTFGGEQAGVAHLDTIATRVDAGALAVCHVEVVADATTADGCVAAAAGDGLVSVPVTTARVLGALEFTATASAADLDAVIGLSSGPATRFADLAATVRFAPGGMIDVRDGDRYRADVSQAYGTGPLEFRVITDLTSHTYSVFQGTELFASELARQYAFRTEQRAAQALDHVAIAVDGAQGSVALCQAWNSPSSGAAYSREGSYTVLPLPGDQALVSDGQGTHRIDAAGQTMGQVPVSGRLAADAGGNVFIASAADTTLVVDKYDASLVHVWNAVQAVPSGFTIQAMSTDASGAVLIAGRPPGAETSIVARFTATGAPAAQHILPGGSVAFDGDQPIVAVADRSTLQITRYTAAGAPVWQRSFAGEIRIGSITVDADHGVLFGGDFFTDVDFGGGTLPFFRPDTGPQNAFLVKLSPAGEHVFSRKTGDSYVHGITTDGARILVSTTLQTQFQYAHLQQYDAAGAFVRDLSPMTGLGESGYADGVVMNRSGRVWWNVATEWPYFPQWPYLVALQL